MSEELRAVKVSARLRDDTLSAWSDSLILAERIAAAEIRRLREEVDRLTGILSSVGSKHHSYAEQLEHIKQLSVSLRESADVLRAIYELKIAQLEKQVERLTLRWTDDPPTEPNRRYHCRSKNGGLRDVAWVWRRGVELWCDVCGDKRPVRRCDYEWSDKPIPEPAEPSAQDPEERG